MKTGWETIMKIIAREMIRSTGMLSTHKNSIVIRRGNGVERRFLKCNMKRPLWMFKKYGKKPKKATEYCL